MSTNLLASAWLETMRQLESQLTRPSLEAWFKDTRLVRIEDDTVVVAVPNPFVRAWISERLAEPLRRALQRALRQEVRLELVVADQADDPSQGEDEAAAALAAAPSTGPANGTPGLPWQSQPLNPKYTFATFVTGNSNRLAHAAALAVAEAPARAYNPLFLYGGVGLGKTHLMQAIAHHVLQRSRQMRVVYVSSETFTNELIDAVRHGKTAEFRNRYRGVDVLLVDDIQFLAGKEMTQEEFFHTFNALHEANRQIVLSSDRPPKEIPTLEERLRSRFEWGLISDIQPPDLETRIAILRKKADIERLHVPDDVIHFIAERITTNIRELEGALIRLVAHASLHNQPISLDLARETLKDILPPARRTAITIGMIQEVVAEYYGLKPKDFKIRKRTRAIAFPRQVAMYLCRELTDSSLPRIGEEFGGRDHTTVLHACEKIAGEAERNPDLAATLELLRQRIRQGL